MFVCVFFKFLLNTCSTVPKRTDPLRRHALASVFVCSSTCAYVSPEFLLQAPRFLRHHFSIVNLCFISPLNMLIFSKQWYSLFTFNCMFYNKKGKIFVKIIGQIKTFNNLVFGFWLCVCVCVRGMCVCAPYSSQWQGRHFNINLINLENRTLICPHLLADTQHGSPPVI